MDNKIETNCLISVIVPIYNVEKYLNKCISSIINQTYKNLQIILVDDGSTDLSGSICDKFADLDKRVQVIHKNNSGLVSARKCGLAIAKGDFIGFIDGDDYADEEMYHILLMSLLDSKADFIHTGFYEGNNEKTRFEEGLIDLNHERLEKLCQFTLDIRSNKLLLPSIWSKLFRASLIKKCYKKVPDGQSYGEDLICFCACILESNNFLLKKTCHYHYTVRDNSISHKNNIQNMIEIFNLYNSLCDLLQEYKSYDKLKTIMYDYLKFNILGCIKSINKDDFQVVQYRFPTPEVIQGKKIVIYGAGMVGKDYYAQICRYSQVRVVAWVDKYYEKYNYEYIQILGIEDIKYLEFDHIIIAVKSQEEADKIRKDLILRLIDKEKIFWCEPQCLV